MTKTVFSSAAAMFWTIASVGCALLAGRVAMVVFGPVLEAPGFTWSPAPAVPSLELPDTLERTLDIPPEPSAEVAPPASVRLTLAVTVGPARSAVYVNGRHVGDTPFVGDVSCKAERPLRIEVVPKRDALIRFSRPCRPGTLRLTEPDPPGLDPPP